MFRTFKHVFYVTNIIIMLIFWIKSLLNLSNVLTIQKRDRQFSSVGFASKLKPNIEGTHYKRWRAKCILWLTAIHSYFVAEPKSAGPHTQEEERAWEHADTMFKATILSVLGDSIVDVYV